MGRRHRPQPTVKKPVLGFVARHHQTKTYSYGPKYKIALPLWLKKWVSNRKA